LNVETLKREYRFLAKSIHPDKNNHPKAGNAFQKLNKLYEEALKKEQFCN
jgi:DnaJ-class molecular chaperone